MKRLLFIACLLLPLAVLAEVVRYDVAATAKTNALATAAGYASQSGYLRRLVILSPAGITNLTVNLTDQDGTSLVTTNYTSVLLTNLTTNVVVNFNAGSLMHGGYAVKTSACLPTNQVNAAIRLSVTEDK
jgi:hypothetical protein